ncbi:16S rRNA (uracil(1498)-N(3))-methyltransferase [Campylobacter sp. MIT 99-7217]|uniref:16S rRNA (uracil(1498)-N(3))-methyltransferase n=1 Tax=Campylobacter sp. MIT 99-7217 TaxID=535091 RepID=UPI00115B9D35|nr:16S rRNA (uracil(1498)-N(3))-methyltransferase [Campylobacter sp. MIT 99-7217]TQR30946.1 16S rRNA (uracil(1498)-N(3))-methyltransferase [Campylobacter sp. MIT 99-7217]
MQFLYHPSAKDEYLSLKNEDFLHLKVRRIKAFDKLILRNLKDDFAYLYELVELQKNSCKLKLISYEKSPSNNTKGVLALGVIDTKNLEKILPFLNELGLDKLVLIYTQFSQKNFKIDLERINRILINSCEQCGRTSLMKIEIFDNVKDFLHAFKHVVLIDFKGKEFDESALKDEKNIFFIGPEGGFSEEERKMFDEKMKLECAFILKSQTAILALATKILL